jgi:hypothetical protein
VTVRAAPLLFIVLAAGACEPSRRGSGEMPPAPAFRGPIVLVTLSALSIEGAAGVGASAMPRLDAFLDEASWAGAGVASAPWCAGSLASVFTGLPPSAHGAGHPAHPWVRPPTLMLAEELQAAGFVTRGYYGTPWVGPLFGMGRGFDSLRPLHRRAPERWLASLDGGPTFTWVHLPLPGPHWGEGDRAAVWR